MKTALRIATLAALLHGAAAFSQDNPILLADDPSYWQASNNMSLERGSTGTLGLNSLRVDVDGHGILESLPFTNDRQPRVVAMDFRVEPHSGTWAGQLQAYLTCPSEGVYNHHLESINLSDYPQGGYNTLSMSIPDNTLAQLADGCEDLQVGIGFTLPAEMPFIEVDRITLNYSVEIESEPLCSPTQVDLAKAVEGEDGFYDFQRWRMPATVADDLVKLSGVRKELESLGIFGIVVDNDSRKIIVPVDNDTAGESILAAVVGVIKENNIAFDIQIQPTCIGFSSFTPIVAILESEVLFPLGLPSYSFNSGASQLRVTVEPAQQINAERLLSPFGSLVDIQINESVEIDRFNDGQAHYGGAALEIGSGPGAKSCTAGFLIERNGERGAAIAAHCYQPDPEGPFLPQGFLIASGTQVYGYVGKIASPEYDVAFIAPQDQRFAANGTLHTDPPSGSTRNIIGSKPPSVGMVVCTSGRNFKAKCGVEITEDNIKRDRIISNRLRKNVWNAAHPDPTRDIVTNGDSGSPVYYPAPGGLAYAIGITIAKKTNSRNNELFLHETRDVLRELGATLVVQD